MSVIFSKQIIDYPSPSIYASDLEVGEIVSFDIWDMNLDFIVVHQGNPNTSIYDSSCNGTWLLCKDLYKTSGMGSKGLRYDNTTLYSSLNSDIFTTLNPKVQACVKDVKIPYYVFSATWDDEYSYYKYTKTSYKGSSGLSAKLFLLSRSEMNDSSYPDDGSCLSYFNHTTNIEDYRIAFTLSSGSGGTYWLRTPAENRNNTTGFSVVREAGSFNSTLVSYSAYVRPACIIYSDTKINSETGAILGR